MASAHVALRRERCVAPTRKRVASGQAAAVVVVAENPFTMQPYCAVVAYSAVRAVLVALTRACLRVRIRGREHVPRTGGFILAPTHRSNIDFVLAGAVTRRRLHFMTKDSVWRVRILGAVVQRLGGFPVSRGAPDRQAIASSLVVLSAGDGLVLFPEGQRRNGSTVQDLHDGVAYLAAKAQVPIIPVGIAGSDIAQPPGRFRIKLLARVRVEVGPPLAAPALTNGRTPRSSIRALTEDLEGALRRLYDVASAD